VRDFISGLFIVVEDQYGVGDFVDLGSATGVVESIGLRVTQVRDLEGTVWYVRNGEILRVGNSSQGWSRVILDLPLAYNADLDKTKKVIEEAAAKLAESLGSKSGLIGKAQVWGIQAIEGESVVFRVVQQVRPSKKDDLARLIRLEVKKAIDKAGIKLSKSPESKSKN
jgi:small conductance mechanosensitive channel